MVIWQKKRQKTKMEIFKFFLESFFFSRRYVLLFFKGGGSNLLYIFFLFWKWWLLIYVTGKKLFWNIFFVFKFRKFRFWFFDAASVYREESPTILHIFCCGMFFFWLLMIFFVDKIKFVLLRWCYFKVHIKLQLSLRTKTYTIQVLLKLFSCLKEWNLMAQDHDSTFKSNHQTKLNKLGFSIVLLILFVTW